jgi:hypothetical protein
MLIVTIVTPPYTIMGRLKVKRSTGHSFVKYVETEGRRGPMVREKVIAPSPLKRRASASPSKTQYSTPYAGDYQLMQDDDPRSPKRTGIRYKVSRL